MPIFIKINNEIGIVPQIINSFNEMWDICGSRGVVGVFLDFGTSTAQFPIYLTLKTFNLDSRYPRASPWNSNRHIRTNLSDPRDNLLPSNRHPGPPSIKSCTGIHFTNGFGWICHDGGRTRWRWVTPWPPRFKPLGEGRARPWIKTNGFSAHRWLTLRTLCPLGPAFGLKWSRKTGLKPPCPLPFHPCRRGESHEAGRHP